jgi:hypothetical protein
MKPVPAAASVVFGDAFCSPAVFVTCRLLHKEAAR